MRPIYYLWLFFNTLANKFSKRFENFLFFYNNDTLYRVSTLNVFQKTFLFFFYNSKNFYRLRLSYRDVSKLSKERLEKYRNVHNFMTYKSAQDQSNIKNNLKNKKTKYSFIKLLGNNLNTSSDDSRKDILTLVILFVKLNRVISNYKLNFFWETLVPKSPSIINAVIFSRLLKHVVSSVAYYKYNVSNLRGFMRIMSDLSKFKKKFESPMLNRRQEKLFNLSPSPDNLIHKIIEQKYKKYHLTISKYKKFYNSTLTNANFNIASNKGLYFYFKEKSNSSVILKKKFLDFYKSFLRINHLPTDASKYFNQNATVTALFIRKNKIFNKGRYSRNRQLYRTGVYWCLILNILGVFGLYYYFYRFVFNFGYFWLPLCILILSIFGSRLVKYRFYNVFNILNEIKMFGVLIESFIHTIVINTSIRTKNFSVRMYYMARFKLRFMFFNFRQSLVNFWHGR